MDELCRSKFWDLNVTWYTDEPDFTDCFKSTTLIWIPCIYLWSSLPFEYCFLKNSKARDIPFNKYNILKLILICLMIVKAIVKSADLRNSFKPLIYHYSNIIEIGSLVLFLVLTLTNIRRGVRSSGILFGFTLILSVCNIPNTKKCIQQLYSFAANNDANSIQLITNFSQNILPFIICLMNCFTDSSPRYFSHTVDKNCYPPKSNDISFPSKLYFFWFDSYLWKNYKKSIENNLWNVIPYLKASKVSLEFETYFNKSSEIKKRKSSNKNKTIKYASANELVELFRSNDCKPNPHHAYPSILKPLWKMYWPTLLKCLCMKTLETCSVLSYPLIFNLLFSFIENNEPSWKGYLCAILFLINSVFQAAILNTFYTSITEVQIGCKAALISVIYKKALRLSNEVRKNYTTGDIMNKMSVDVIRIFDFIRAIFNLWAPPIQIVWSFYFVWNILGDSIFVNIIVLLLITPLVNYTMKCLKTIQIKEMSLKDRRIKFIQDMLAGIKILKMYTWETDFKKKVINIREEEMKIIQKRFRLNAFNTFLFRGLPIMMSSSTFATYIISNINHSMNVKNAFVTISFLNALKNPLQSVPQTFSSLIQASVSVKRINQFLNLEELELDMVSHDNTKEDLIITNGTFSWTGKNGLPTLSKINLKIEKGSLVAIVGSVGSGKSSLISALLGEMHKNEGYVNINGKIAFVPQQAWILNSSFKENITLGDPINEELYHNAIEACALESDLLHMPNYDLTEIGEKGVNLSGGQKQKINLARAICDDADIYFLDDPFSAVDHNERRHIFENVVGPNSMLKNKTRVLITHSIEFLPEVENIIVLENGQISESGTYTELLNKNGDFSKLLKTHLIENNSSVESEMNYEKIKSENVNNTQNLQKTTDTNKLIEKERLETKHTGKKVYMFHLSAVGLLWTLSTLGMFVLLQVIAMISNLWLLKWSSSTKSNEPEDSDRYLNVEIYVFLSFIEATTMLSSYIILFMGVIKASTFLHNKLVQSVLRWPNWLFDCTPIGRISSRFTVDIYALDSFFGVRLAVCLDLVGKLISIFLVIIYITPICILLITPIIVILIIYQRFHSLIAQQIKRIDSINNSPLYSHLMETISGIELIRANGYQQKCIQKMYEKLDIVSTSQILSNTQIRCLGTKMDLLGGCMGFFATFFAIWNRDVLNVGLIGFSISYALQMTRELTWLLMFMIDVENGIIATERIKEFIEYPQEASTELESDKKYKNWPSTGEIIFQNYKLKYRRDFDFVLNDISFHIRSGEKIGIVGRSGAGKSSLILGLFRLVEPAAGKILIDDVDITTLGLRLLRSQIAIIPQDPILFLGTLRFNLDPGGNYDDECLWEQLEKINLKNFVQHLPNGLQYNIDEGGGNLSLGQKQLICLARALLRKTKILILDEATASIDVETDELIRRTVRNEFAECTVLTITHKINMVIDYDRIMVIDRGRLVEFDTPANLLSLKSSKFYKMGCKLAARN